MAGREFYNAFRKRKIVADEYYQVGFDPYSDNYILEVTDMVGNTRYFIITKAQYEKLAHTDAAGRGKSGK